MDLIFVLSSTPPKKSYVEALIPNAIVFGDGAFQS